jgi:RsiW-degrading membrane proteinase PrsW (M82 family)
MTELLTSGAVGLLPVMCFLLALNYMDSYKLHTPQVIIRTIFFGAITALASYGFNSMFLQLLDIQTVTYSRYVAPFVEEALKGFVIVFLIVTNRCAFLVGAAIFGFAVGTGFAVVENLHYLRLLSDAHIAVWIVRGFGTALMHGGATAIFAIVSTAMVESSGKAGLKEFAPGYLIAVIVHSAFNHFIGSPIISTLGILVLLPALIHLAFRQSERAVQDWLGIGFDADVEIVQLIQSGGLSESHVGEYLEWVRRRFDGMVVADMLCYLRVHKELAIRAKGLLLARENGIDVPVGDRTRAKLEELKYLEKSIGKTGKLAIAPLLRLDRKELWQIYMLDQEGISDA